MRSWKQSRDFENVAVQHNTTWHAISWWPHQVETFSALLAICVGNSPVPAQRPVARSFDVFFDLRPNKRLGKKWWRWWLQTPSTHIKILTPDVSHNQDFNKGHQRGLGCCRLYAHRNQLAIWIGYTAICMVLPIWMPNSFIKNT